MVKVMHLRVTQEQWAWLRIEASKRSEPAPAKQLTSTDILRGILIKAIEEIQSEMRESA